MHGHGVANGMRIAIEYAIRRGICPAEVLPALSKLLTQYDLPTATEYAVDDLYEAATHDKKREGGHIDVVLPTGIGGCMLQRIPVTELPDFLRGGRS
jgi:3-dehydroquinate synthase